MYEDFAPPIDQKQPHNSTKNRLGVSKLDPVSGVGLKKRRLSPVDIEARQKAEEEVKRVGAHKSFNRGLYDRYTT